MSGGDDQGAPARDLGAALAAAGVEGEIVDLGVPMTTAAAAAQQLKVPLARIFKSLVVAGPGGEVAVLVLPGDRRVDMKAAGRRLGWRSVTFASPEVVLRETGYPAGGTPPAGYPRALPVLVDQSALEHEEAYCGGGRPELLLRIRVPELVRAAGGAVEAISRPMKEEAH